MNVNLKNAETYILRHYRDCEGRDRRGRSQCLLKTSRTECCCILHALGAYGSVKRTLPWNTKLATDISSARVIRRIRRLGKRHTKENREIAVQYTLEDAVVQGGDWSPGIAVRHVQFE
jgi:hypothetical protein